MAANLPVFQPDSYKRPEVWEQFPRAQARPAGDGLRHAVRAGGLPQHPDARLDPVSPLAAAGLPRRVRDQLADHQGREGDRLSIFWPDNGLDTGDVLDPEEDADLGTDTLGTVYFDRLFPMGVDAMLEGVDLVKAGKAPRIKQDESKATYEGRCGPAMRTSTGASRGSRSTG
jgi:methionyl-tRNA formyltransferase